MTYYFFYVDQEGKEYRFYNLSKRKAVSMYNLFNRDMAIHGYKKVGWSMT
jgi:hypothetical protein